MNSSSVLHMSLSFIHGWSFGNANGRPSSATAELRGIMILSALEQRRMESGGHTKRNYGGSASLKRTESKL